MRHNVEVYLPECGTPSRMCSALSFMEAMRHFREARLMLARGGHGAPTLVPIDGGAQAVYPDGATITIVAVA